MQKQTYKKTFPPAKRDDCPSCGFYANLRHIKEGFYLCRSCKEDYNALIREAYA